MMLTKEENMQLSGEELITILEGIVDQANAQFKCGDRYATFRRQMIDDIRPKLEEAKKIFR